MIYYSLVVIYFLIITKTFIMNIIIIKILLINLIIYGLFIKNNIPTNNTFKRSQVTIKTERRI